MNKTILEEAKKWFGHGEIDVDLMIANHVITEEEILSMYLIK